jgi:hypothetical protein
VCMNRKCFFYVEKILQGKILHCTTKVPHEKGIHKQVDLQKSVKTSLFRSELSWFVVIQKPLVMVNGKVMKTLDDII